MDLLKIAFSAFGSMVTLFLLTKIMGNRQMSQMSMYDYVSSVAIGSIAGEMAIRSTDSFFEPLVAMLVFTVFSMLIAYYTCKSIILRRFFEGHSLLLYEDGRIYEKNLLKATMDVDELLSACRLNGYYDLQEVHTVYLETNGQISILPKAESRPVTPQDLNLNPKQSVPLANVIIDGNIMHDIVDFVGINEAWIHEQLKSYKVKDIHDIILGTYNRADQSLQIYIKLNKKMTMDIFE